MIFLVLILAGCFIAFRSLIYKDDVLTHQVDIYGGMQNKYVVLVNQFLSDPNARIIQIRRDEITIRALGGYGLSETYTIKEAPQKTHIFWECDWLHLGKHKNSWVFPDSLSQEVMLSEIAKYMDKKFPLSTFK